MEYLDRAKKDFLTGCFAREEMDGILSGVKVDCDLRKKPFSVLVVDIDHFKAYNDKYGHLDGDDVLKYFASTLRLSFAENGCIPIRFGGDEFIVVFPDKSAGEVNSFAKDFSRNLRKRPFLMRGRIFNMRFSGGIVSYPADGTDADKLLEKADRAMYYSKEHGRGRTTYYGRMRSKTIRSFVIILIALAITGFSYYKLHSERAKIGDAVDRVRRGMGVVFAPSPDGPADKKSLPMDYVYMKSGRVFSGRVVRETDDSIEFRLQLTIGEGSVVINRTDIDRIEKDAVKK